MADASTSSATAAPAAATTASPAASATLGGTIDAEIVVLKSRLAAIEAAGKTDWTAAVAWAKANWAHIALTWPAAATVLTPAVKTLLKAVL
jgi:hypothetical protein